MLCRVALVRTDFSEELSIVTANVFPSPPILVTLMMDALSSSETSVLTRVTRRNNPEDSIRHSHSREDLKSYMCFLVFIIRNDGQCPESQQILT
jgi:hypothetical protein